MRAMQHNSRANSAGRVHGTKHNDRDFDTDRADNIDKARSEENVYWHLYQTEHPEMTFTEAELKFYVETFGEQLQKTNDNYLRQSHPERCKDMETWKMARQNAPEETVLQIGKMEGHADAATLMDCFQEYNRRLEQWNQDHGKPFTQLSYALHVDEAVPHIQTRRVWHYQDAQGMTKIGQEKALAKAGVELPDPNWKETRKNNRKVAFDKMAREMWLDVLHEYGLDIEREPVPDGKHNREKEAMIRDKYQEMVDATDQMKGQLRDMQQEYDDLQTSVESTRETLEDLQEDVNWTREEVAANQELVLAYQDEAAQAEQERFEAEQKRDEAFRNRDIALKEQQKVMQEISVNAQQGKKLMETIRESKDFQRSLKEDIKAKEARSTDLEAKLDSLTLQIDNAKEELSILNKAIEKKNDEGERNMGMTGWNAAIAQAKEDKEKEKKENLLAKFAEYVIETFPAIRALWEKFQRDHQQSKKKTKGIAQPEHQ